MHKRKKGNSSSSSTSSSAQVAPIVESRGIVQDFLYNGLWEPVSISSLVVYRVMWGIIMFYESLTYLMYNYGKLEYILQLRVRFKYYGFEWIQLWPGNGMYLHVHLCAVMAFCVACGFYYRFCSIAFFLMFSFLFLQEMTLYLNHFYLVCIICFVFTFLPLNQCYSLDSYLENRRRRKQGLPELNNDTVPYWCLWTMQAFIVIVYTFAGLAKLNEDWLRGEPLLHWLPRRKEIPILGYFLVQPAVAILFSYGGLLLDLFVGPLMWFRLTRPIGFLALVFFHGMNKIIFNIGIFPWVMLASTTIFFSPDWAVRLWHALQTRDFSIFWKEEEKPKRSVSTSLTRKQKLTLVFLAVFLGHQILVPLRHWTYSRNVNWTEEGHRWAWRMKLRDKTGVAQFYVTDPVTNVTTEVDQNRLLTLKQQQKISCRPELIHLFAHDLANRYRNHTKKWPRVTAKVVCSLNYRPYQYMVLPNFDLASIPPWTWPNDWVIDLIPLGVTNSPYLAPDPGIKVYGD